jgi:hypothetical protein
MQNKKQPSIIEVASSGALKEGFALTQSGYNHLLTSRSELREFSQTETLVALLNKVIAQAVDQVATTHSWDRAGKWAAHMHLCLFSSVLEMMCQKTQVSSGNPLEEMAALLIALGNPPKATRPDTGWPSGDQDSGAPGEEDISD